MTGRGHDTGHLDERINGCVTQLATAADEIFETLDELGNALAGAWHARTHAGNAYATSDLAALQPEVFDVLDRHPAFNSAGFVLAEGTLDDRARHLDWWHRTTTDRYEFLVLNLDPGTIDCYDYYAMEWFDAAVSEHRRFVSGPLIDLPCADVYIMTFSSPIIVDEVVLGVAGADVSVALFESRIMPPLRTLAVDALLVNRERRVIASNVATFTTGEKLPTRPGADDTWRTVVPVTDDLGWILCVGHAPVE
ncbi:MAG: cache domain-containing protein [Ilumatobacteraceae bacterium]